MNSKQKAILYLVLSVIFGAISLVTFSQVLLLVVNDILLGALSGAPETGWGILFVEVFYGPVALGTGALAYLLAKRYKYSTGKSFRIPIFAAVGVAIILGSLAYTYWG